MENGLYVAAVYLDLYDDESKFDGIRIGTAEDVAEWVNSKADDFADSCGIPKVPHDYGDEVDGECEQSVYLPVLPDGEYYSHLLVEDSNTNRIRVEIRRVEIKVQ